MISVYWWAGLLCPNPEFFHLINYGGKSVYPDENVIAGVYNMTAVDEPINLSIDGEVGFDEFPPQVMKNVDADDQMVSIRLEYKEKLMKNTNTISVSRENIFDDLIKAYKKRGVSSKELRITFIDEDAVGDGVTRDAYASFFNALYAKFEGEKEKLPPLDMDKETLILIGQIITHVSYSTANFHIRYAMLLFYITYMELLRMNISFLHILITYQIKNPK